MLVKHSQSAADDQLSLIMQAALGESPGQAKKIAKDWYRYRNIVKAFWERAASASLSESLHQAAKIDMPGESLLHHFLKDSRQGLALLTIHMGDYLHAYLKILGLTEGREVIILRRKAWTEADQDSFGKLNQIGHRLSIVRHGEGAAKKIVKALRRGAIVIMLYDLPARWGMTGPVSMFSHQLHWVLGPVQLAILGKSCLLPFFTFEVEGAWYCELNPIRDYRAVNRCRHDLIARETQILATLAEQTIRAHLSQWNHWHLYPEMLQQKVTENA